MSVSLVADPNDISPAYNPLRFEFSSTNSSECEFSYVGDLYVNGVFAVRLKAIPEGVSNNGVFRVEEILQDYLTFDFNPELEGIDQNQNSIRSYYLEVRESYNTDLDCLGDVTVTAVLLTTDTYYTWNASLQYHEFPVYTVNEYTQTNSLSKWMSDVPIMTPIGIEDFSTIGFLQKLAGNRTDEIRIKTFRTNGTLINTYVITNAVSSPSTVFDRFLKVGVGPANLNGYFSAQSPSQTPITSEVDYYSIQAYDVTDVLISQTKFFKIDTKCSRFARFRVWWKNHYGEFDSFSFNLRSIKRQDSTQVSYVKTLPFDYVPGQRGETVIDIESSESFVLNTDYVSEDVGKWMNELFSSPEVYIYDFTEKKVNYTITGATCTCFPSTFDITSAVHNVDGTADISIDDSAVGAGNIPIGTVFGYIGTGFNFIGSPNSGGGKTITGYTGVFYTTDIVSTISAGAPITGTLTPTPSLGCYITIAVPTEITLEIGTQFSYIIDDGPSFGASNMGAGTILEDLGSGQYKTDVPCSIGVGVLLNGLITFYAEQSKLIPVVITNRAYEEKLKSSVKNIQYTLECKASYKKNVQ